MYAMGYECSGRCESMTTYGLQKRDHVFGAEKDNYEKNETHATELPYHGFRWLFLISFSNWRLLLRYLHGWRERVTSMFYFPQLDAGSMTDGLLRNVSS